MTRTLRHGSDGYTLIEAVITIFIASTALCAVLALASIAIKSSSKTINQVSELITQRNYEAEKFFSAK